MTDLRHSN